MIHSKISDIFALGRPFLKPSRIVTIDQTDQLYWPSLDLPSPVYHFLGGPTIFTLD